MAETPDDPYCMHGDGLFKRKLYPFRRKTDALLERMDADRKVAFFLRDAASFTYAWYRTVKAAHVWHVFRYWVQTSFSQPVAPGLHARIRIVDISRFCRCSSRRSVSFGPHDRLRIKWRLNERVWRTV